ncbi:MAG: thiolase family protein [Leptospirales bacterium]|nr:thiolase family protein [Leptospirales bacterium]
MKLPHRVAVSTLRRTPFAQIAKGLAPYQSHELGFIVAKDIIDQSKLKLSELDGVLVGEGFPFAPNPARVIANKLGVPVETPALTLANNCVSSMEAVAEAARRINLGEGKVYLTLGEESQTHIPFVVKNARANKKAGSIDKLMKLLPDQLPADVKIMDSLEEGLGDSETSYGMAVTAEVVAQNYGISREISDKLAYTSYKRAYDATLAGKYKPFLVPVKDDEGSEMVDDEAVMLRKGIVENPSRMDKAMLLFENPVMKFDQFKTQYKDFLQKSTTPTVTIFNACARSDGAAGAIISSEEKARELGLKVQAYITGFRMKGVHPNLMGIGQAEASLALLEDLGITIDQVDQIEIHEAFAATAIGALEEIKKRTGLDWEKKFEAGRINAYGGSIALGHPFGATGIRLIGNAIMVMNEHSDVKRVLITACAHGGVAGAMMIERA